MFIYIQFWNRYRKLDDAAKYSNSLVFILKPFLSRNKHFRYKKNGDSQFISDEIYNF